MPNRLIRETSPYLQHHAENPVDWYPWGAEALERAKQERKPIHLSIGYAACHWCHVMAAESFQDEETAQLLNELFVNIKVDREERPDIDRIYQIAQQMLTQRSGGWPLTMFLTHDDQRPFFGGTYFPKQARYGMPAFRDLITRVAQYYREQQTELREQNAALVAALDDLNPPPAPARVELTSAPLSTCREQLARTFDSKFGGFSAAPKFPHPRNIEFLLRRWQSSAGEPEPDLQALYMATLTLRRMGEGGVNDQLGGGFCRYSVDDYWMIPHFEKMLYDNAELLAAYAQAAVATGDAFYANVAQATATWAMREMQDPDGGFYSSLDADSEGHEGKFYVWDADEPRRVLNAEEYAVFAARYGLDREPNFEGRWHLHTYRSLEDTAAAARLPLSVSPTAAIPGSSDSSDEVERLIDSARRKLLAIRSKRIWPARDEKVLTSWNALMIRGLAMAARTLRRDDFAAAATSALNFIRASHWRDGRLLATSKEGRAHLNAYLDDYVYLTDAILELQQVRFRADELAFARELLEVALGRFEDKQLGGFFFTSDDHEQLIHRSRAFSDDATPAGNGVAAFVLQRMGYLLGEPQYLKAAEHTLRAAWSALERYPQAHVSLLTALDELSTPPEIVILRGRADVIELWRSELVKLYAPRRMIIAIPADSGELPSALAEKKAHGEAVAYVCTGSTCSAPVDSLGTLIQQLRAASSKPA